MVRINEEKKDRTNIGTNPDYLWAFLLWFYHFRTYKLCTVHSPPPPPTHWRKRQGNFLKRDPHYRCLTSRVISATDDGSYLKGE
jgi:hypothetical protein